MTDHFDDVSRIVDGDGHQLPVGSVVVRDHQPPSVFVVGGVLDAMHARDHGLEVRDRVVTGRV